MRTSSLQSVLDLVAQKVNGTGADGLGAQEMATTVARINEQLRECWERDAWPEWCPVEERFYRPTWRVGPDYPEATEAYYNGAYWYATAENADPPEDGSLWVPLTDEETVGHPFRRYVGLDQTTFAGAALTPIGTVLGAYQSDPRVRPGARRVDYTLTPDGIEIVRFTGTSVWLHFRQRPPVFTSSLFDAEASYVAGQKVYFAGAAGAFLEGDCYECADDTAAGESPESDPELWTKIAFPYVLKHAVADFVFAEALEEDGQTDRASKRREKAEETLATEWGKSETQQGIVRTFRVLNRPGVESASGVTTSSTITV